MGQRKVLVIKYFGPKIFFGSKFFWVKKGPDTLLNGNNFYMIAALYFAKISIKQKLQMPGATERNIAGISE